MARTKAVSTPTHPSDPEAADTTTPSLQQPLLETATTTQDEGLLPVIAIVDTEQRLLNSSFGTTSLFISAILLCKTIIGAGSAALPFAFSKLGLIFSISGLLLMAWLTHFSIQALASSSIRLGELSYPVLVKNILGRTPSIVLELSLMLRCAGLSVVYIVIATDILAGGDQLPGVLCDAFCSDSDSSSSDDSSGAWCHDRWLIGLILTILVLIPLVLPRKLSSAAVASYIGMSAVVLWVISTVYLAYYTCFIDGNCHSLPLLPYFNTTDSGSGSKAELITELLGTLPVIATAFTCQMTVHFIMKDLRGFNQVRMDAVSVVAVSVCTVVFIVIGVGSIAAFGKKVPSDILKAFDTKALAKIVGGKTAQTMGITVRTGFLLSILANVPMQMLPYRESLFRLVLGKELTGTPMYIVSVVSLGVFYLIAMVSKNIYKPLQLVGATAGAIIAFLFPGFLALKSADSREWGVLIPPLYWRVGGVVLIVLGVVQCVTGIAAFFML